MPVLFGLIPIATGDWRWALLLLPAALLAAHVMVQRRSANLARRRSLPPTT